MASSSTSRKIDEVEVIQERDYVESETSSKYIINIINYYIILLYYILY